MKTEKTKKGRKTSMASDPQKWLDKTLKLKLFYQNMTFRDFIRKYFTQFENSFNHAKDGSCEDRENFYVDLVHFGYRCGIADKAILKLERDLGTDEAKKNR